jgi:hypothetical protein
MPFNAFNSIARLPKKTGGAPIVTWVAGGYGGGDNYGNTTAYSYNGTSWD